MYTRLYLWPKLQPPNGGAHRILDRGLFRIVQGSLLDTALSSHAR